jgi:DMSO/TMAO reductase YedYZ molybdopterin-dependent catalytic subunit
MNDGPSGRRPRSTDSEAASRSPDGQGGGGRLRYTRRRFLVTAGAVVASAAGLVVLVRRALGDKGATTLSGPLGRPYGSFPVNTVERTPPDVAAADWVLVVDGLVERPLRFDRVSWEALPRVDKTADFHCVEGWSVEDVRWEGVAPAVLLEQAGLKPEAAHVTFHAYRSTYADSIPLELVRDPLTLMADRVDGQPLPAEHGGPLRLVVSRQLGYKSVKWVDRLEVTDKPVTGYWERRGYPMDAPIPS